MAHKLSGKIFHAGITRVELHPATDAWMMGDRHGMVERVGRAYLYIRMDRSGKLRKVAYQNIGGVIMD